MNRVRLREEHERLNGLQIQLKAEQDSLRQDATEQRSMLRAREEEFEREKKAMRDKLHRAEEEVFISFL